MNEKIFGSIMVSVFSSGKPTLIESTLQKLRGKPTRESNQDPTKYKQNFSFRVQGITLSFSH